MRRARAAHPRVLVILETALMPDAHPNDPVTLAEVAALLIGVALVASYVPARRGSRVDPLAAVRHE